MAPPDQVLQIWEIIKLHLNDVRFIINQKYAEVEPLFLILGTAVVVFTIVWIYSFLFKEESLGSRFKRKFFRIVRNLPYIKERIEKEIAKTKYILEKDMMEDCHGIPFVEKLPDTGISKEEIIENAEKYLGLGKIDWKHGRVSGAVYNYTEELNDVTCAVYKMGAYTNPLHPDVFPGVRKMEAEVVRMTCSLFNGGEESCGVMTSGGTESIILACKAYRDRAIDLGIERPEIVVPVTAHAAFDKGCNLMRMKIRHIPVDPKTMQVNVNAMRRAINKNTCMLVGSAPQFPHGIIDPIQEIAKLGVKYNIPVHVDCCLGGFLLPFMEQAGYPLPPFDFRLPGVTSISADTHKYGSAPKGSSILMYSNEANRHYQFFVQPDWPGGIYASPSIPGSRAGGIIAACWAAMMFIGEDGYVENTRKIIETTRTILKGLRQIKGIKILGEPLVSVIAIASDNFMIYRLSDAMTKLGWSLNLLQFPSSIHLCVTRMHTQEGVAEQFLKDVEDSVKIILDNPLQKQEGKGAIYGMTQSIPDRNMVAEMACLFLDACYRTTEPIDPGFDT